MQNYFDFLGVEPSFTLNEADLHRRYVALQQQYHPDRLVGKPEAERLDSVQRSMLANDAFETLKSPLTRAEHLLALQGIWVNTDGADTVKPDPALLMEMMELREQLSDCHDEIGLARAIHDIKAAMRLVEASLAESFASVDYPAAAQRTIRLRYFGKALEEAMITHYRIKAAS